MNRLCFLLLALSLAAVVPGCGKGHNETADGPPQKKLKLAFVCNNSSDFWSIVRLGCEFGVSQVAPGVDLDFREPEGHSVAEQQNIVSNLVAGGVDGIAISAIDPDSQTELLNSIAPRALLVCVDGDVEKSKRVCYIGSDNVAAGKQAAELLKTALPQGGKVALFVGYLNAQNARDRIEGLKSGLAGSNIEIVGTLVDDSKSILAEKNALDTLAKYPDLAGMVGLFSYDGPALLSAVRGAGKAGHVQIVCFDEDNETLAGIAAGDICGTIVQKPFLIGSETIVRMAKYLRGDKTQLAGGRVLTPTSVITKVNLDSFRLVLKDQKEKSQRQK
jgi:ribose transport system substrate-binding protein